MPVRPWDKARVASQMTLPISTEYLSLALQDGIQIGDTTLRQHNIGDLILPTGKLVACDPFVTPGAGPFSLLVPRGTFPVVLSVEEAATDQRVAFAAVRVKQTSPTKWQMMATGANDPSKLEPGDIFGYGVDSGTGCFMDESAGRALTQKMNDDSNFFKTMMTEMEKNYRDTWDWLNMKFGDGNLIAFKSGLGDGVYATYAGLDPQGEVAVVVTDFMVLDEDAKTG
jgi:Protein of unknown function (DUF4241)